MFQRTQSSFCANPRLSVGNLREGAKSGFRWMGMSEGGREQENSTGNISQQEEKELRERESRVEGEISEGERPSMSTDCASPIGKS